ncbi:hypothetical protein [Haloactinomyces albus]|uniref:Uncharacterized protein n=1 Tax=Haloactinomyces albus TaxID=1352928 RepID=A0AAE3ZBI1_9ACTN|nr:hypothetical protein [Haloactinomyces albus]MDR7300855.1 hypothetical protein [Haloactinomyces albus]
METAVLANPEPGLFGAFDTDAWPSTSMPAFELIAAARRVQGVRAAEEVDYQVRLLERTAARYGAFDGCHHRA